MTITCKFTLNIGLMGTQEDHVEVEVPDNFRELPAEQQTDILHQEWKEWMWNYVDGSYDEAGEDDE